MITFSCNQCGHDIAVDDSLAGQACRCAACGHESIVPSGGFRLQPLPEEERDQTPNVEPYELAGDEPPPAVLEPLDRTYPDPAVDAEGADAIPEEFLADRAPLAVDDGETAEDQEGPIPLSE